MSYEVFGQLVLAALLGVLIGTERRLSHKTAGMRTFALVSLGSALFTIISSMFVSDPARIASQVVVGIGFLGAGMIVLRGGSTLGLTTAACLWTAAGIGMAVGLRLYALAIFATLLAIVIFLVLWWI